MIEVIPHERGSVLPVRAQPGARRDALLGERAGALRIAVSAAPERGKANEAIVALLAEALGCRRSEIRLVSGATARDKRFLIEGLTPEQLRGRLPAALDE